MTFLTNAEIDAMKLLAEYSTLCMCECTGCEFAKFIGNSTCVPILADRWLKYEKQRGNL